MEENRNLTFKEVFDWIRANIKNSKSYELEDLKIDIKVTTDILSPSDSGKEYSIIIHRKDSWNMFITPVMRIVDTGDVTDYVDDEKIIASSKFITPIFMDIYIMGASLFFYYDYEDNLPCMDINYEDISDILHKIMDDDKGE